MMKLLRRLFDNDNANPSQPLCPQCKSAAETATKWLRGEPRLHDEVWTVQETPTFIARCPACNHEWTVRVDGTFQAFSRRPEGPFVIAGSLLDLTPVHLHLLEIAFDLGQHDAPQPNAWTPVQWYIQAHGNFGGMSSVLDDLHKITAAVEQGIETGLYGNELLQMAPKWEAAGAYPTAEFTVTWGLEEAYTCDRLWLLERLNTLLATYAQSHDATYAQKCQSLMEAGRRAVEAQSAPVQPKPAPWCQVVIAGLMTIAALAGAWRGLVKLSDIALYTDFWLLLAIMVAIGICIVLSCEVLAPWLSRRICPKS